MRCPQYAQAQAARVPKNKRRNDLAFMRSPRCLTNTSQPIPDIERPKCGRPPRLTPEKLYATLQRIADGYTVMQIQAELAQRYKISVPTIRRPIAALKQQ